jgi:hypothetical protein
MPDAMPLALHALVLTFPCGVERVERDGKAVHGRVPDRPFAKRNVH